VYNFKELFEERVGKEYRNILENEHRDLLEMAYSMLNNNGCNIKKFYENIERRLSTLIPSSKPYIAVKQLQDFVAHAFLSSEDESFDRTRILDIKTHNKRIFDYYGNSEAHFEDIDDL